MELTCTISLLSFLWIGALLEAALAFAPRAFVPKHYPLKHQQQISTQHTRIFQAHQEIDDYREGISSSFTGGNLDKNNDIKDVVMKFGGSSLADASRVDHVANLIKGQIEVGYRPRAVVCSASKFVTDYQTMKLLILDGKPLLNYLLFNPFPLLIPVGKTTNALLSAGDVALGKLLCIFGYVPFNDFRGSAQLCIYVYSKMAEFV